MIFNQKKFYCLIHNIAPCIFYNYSTYDKNLIFEYLDTCDVIANCIFIDNDDIDNIIDEYEEEFLKFYLKLKKINEYLDYTKCAMFTSCILLFN